MSSQNPRACDASKNTQPAYDEVDALIGPLEYAYQSSVRDVEMDIDLIKEFGSLENANAAKKVSCLYCKRQFAKSHWFKEIHARRCMNEKLGHFAHGEDGRCPHCLVILKHKDLDVHLKSNPECKATWDDIMVTDKKSVNPDYRVPKYTRTLSPSAYQQGEDKSCDC